MKYFNKVKSVEELKTMYKKLAKENHPDMGGDVEVMKAINNEFDMLCHVLPESVRADVVSARSEFYTINGWKGSNYDIHLSVVEIAKKVKQFCKEMYPECKFSVTTKSYSGGCSLYVTLVESPYRLNKTFDELTESELYDGHYSYYYQFGHSTTEEEKTYFLKTCYTNDIKKIMSDVTRYTQSYRYSDCDGMIDYFDTNFYFSRCEVNTYGKTYKQDESRLAKRRKVLAEV